MTTFLRQPYTGIQKPSLAGRTVMTNSGPYTMQGASSGGVTTQQGVRQPVYTSGPAWDNSAPNARQQMDNAMANMGRYMPPNIQVSNVRQSYMGNNNPALQGGISTVQVGNELVRVPNALIQQLMFQDSWNAGRSNAMQDFFGGQNPNPDVYKYSTIGADQGRMERYLANNPQFNQEGALNPYVRAQENANRAYSNLQQAQMMGQQPRTERVSVGGQVIDDGGQKQRQQQLDQAQQQYDASVGQFNKFNSRGAKVQAYNQERDTMNQMFKDIGRISPTYSNLQIKETYL